MSVKPRAKTVFEAVREKHEEYTQSSTTNTTADKPESEPAVQNSLHFFGVANEREYNRFFALLGVLIAHLMSTLVTFWLMLLFCGLVFGVGLGFSLWDQAIAALCISVGGPILFFFYRYWSGRY